MKRPGNITDLTIGEPQFKLAEALIATGKPIVLVLVEGRPRIINRIADNERDRDGLQPEQ